MHAVFSKSLSLSLASQGDGTGLHVYFSMKTPFSCLFLFLLSFKPSFVCQRHFHVIVI